MINSGHPHTRELCVETWVMRTTMVSRKLSLNRETFSKYVCFAGSYFSSNSGTLPIAMDYVNCSGLEFRLWDCNHFTHSFGCTHSNDVGVRCQPGLSFQLEKANLLNTR